MLFIAPFPPQIDGQCIASEALATRLSQHVVVRRHDIGTAGLNGRMARIARRALGHIKAACSIAFGQGPVYISVNSNAGMYLSVILAGLARMRKHRLYLHHHAYAHIRSHRRAMAMLARIAGPVARHIVLGKAMAEDIKAHYAQVQRVIVLNNAGLVDPLLRTIARQHHAQFTLGHISNLCAEKGIDLVIDTAIAAVRAGADIHLVVAGNCVDNAACLAVNRAEHMLGNRFRYLGPIEGGAKRDFFGAIDVVLFPSRYKNEAEPLVVLEALSSGAPVLATPLGCISDDIGVKGGVTISDDVFIIDATKWIVNSVPSVALALGAREQFDSIYLENSLQFRSLIDDIIR